MERDVLRLQVWHSYPHTKSKPCSLGGRRFVCRANDRVALELPAGEGFTARANAITPQPVPLAEVPWVRGMPR